MPYPTDCKYTKEHEWIKVDGTTATIGITDYAQESLGDIVFVEMPKVGAELTAGKTFGIGRIGEGGVGSVRSRFRHRDRSERRTGDRAGEDQQRCARLLDDQNHAEKSG